MLSRDASNTSRNEVEVEDNVLDFFDKEKGFNAKDKIFSFMNINTCIYL